jgi:hypothetical protein
LKYGLVILRFNLKFEYDLKQRIPKKEGQAELCHEAEGGVIPETVMTG